LWQLTLMLMQEMLMLTPMQAMQAMQMTQVMQAMQETQEMLTLAQPHPLQQQTPQHFLTCLTQLNKQL
jgi:hypothetical protein